MSNGTNLDENTSLDLTTGETKTRTKSQQTFYENIKDGKFFEAMVEIITDISHLKVVTIVEDEKDQVSAANNSQGIGRRMVTEIGLIDGDITNIVGSIFLTDNNSYQQILEMHKEQVNKGQDIIDKNIQSLEKALGVLKKLREEFRRS